MSSDCNKFYNKDNNNNHNKIVDYEITIPSKNKNKIFFEMEYTNHCNRWWPMQYGNYKQSYFRKFLSRWRLDSNLSEKKFSSFAMQIVTVWLKQFPSSMDCHKNDFDSYIKLFFFLWGLLKYVPVLPWIRILLSRAPFCQR